MHIGKVVKEGETERPKRVETPVAIPVPDWPVKQPEKVPQKTEAK